MNVSRREHALTVAGFMLVLIAATSAWLSLGAVDAGGQGEFVRMYVRNVVRGQVPDGYAVVLTDTTEDPKLALLVLVGQNEAAAIVRALHGISTPRPLTHDLLDNTIRKLGATVEKVSITKLERGTFFGEIRLKRGDDTIVIDSRPSDAMALAVRANAPVFVAKAVLEQAGEKIPPGGEGSGQPGRRRPVPPDAI